jgi:hypothetical protein
MKTFGGILNNFLIRYPFNAYAIQNRRIVVGTRARNYGNPYFFIGLNITRALGGIEP